MFGSSRRYGRTQVNYNGAWHSYPDLAVEVGLSVPTAKARVCKRLCLLGRKDAPLLLSETQHLAARFLCGRQP